VLEVKGTKRFTTAGGGTRTVFVVSPVTLPGLPTAEQYERAQKQAAALKEAEIAAKRARQEKEEAAAAEKRAKAKAERVATEAKEKAEREAAWAKEKAKREAERAAAKLKLIKELLRDDRNKDTAKRRLEELIKEYPDSEAAKEARKILADIKR
jgi:hypothetical protein